MKFFLFVSLPEFTFCRTYDNSPWSGLNLGTLLYQIIYFIVESGITCSCCRIYEQKIKKKLNRKTHIKIPIRGHYYQAQESWRLICFLRHATRGLLKGKIFSSDKIQILFYTTEFLKYVIKCTELNTDPVTHCLIFQQTKSI